MSGLLSDNSLNYERVQTLGPLGNVGLLPSVDYIILWGVCDSCDVLWGVWVGLSVLPSASLLAVKLLPPPVPPQIQTQGGKLPAVMVLAVNMVYLQSKFPATVMVTINDPIYPVFSCLVTNIITSHDVIVTSHDVIVTSHDVTITPCDIIIISYIRKQQSHSWSQWLP